MGIRNEEKARTRERIIEASKFLIQRKGFIKVSSNEIAKECGVSHGTIFLHFGTKENLINTILSSNIESYKNELLATCRVLDEPDVLLRNYLDVTAKYEDILARIYKEYSYLHSSLAKDIDSLDTTIKNLIFDNYKKNVEKRMSIVDSFIALDAFLSQIKDYLISKDTFTSTNSVIRQKRGRISKLYKMLFGGE